MAINPATLKVIAKAVAGVATSKDKNNNLLYIILIAVSLAVTVILLPIYILTYPFEMLKSNVPLSADENEYIEQYKIDNDEKMLVIGEDLTLIGRYPLPIKDAEITNEYGEKTDPDNGVVSFHYGTDFAGEWRSEIFSVADGVVKEVCTEKNNGYGNYIIVEHKGQRNTEDGTAATETFYALYGYLNEIYMFEGQSLKKGAVIGLMGGDPKKDINHGKSAYTHLYFEIRSTQNGSGIDPVGYIFPEQQSEESEATTSG